MKGSPFAVLLMVFGSTAFAFNQAENDARFVYQRLTGKILRQGTPVYNEMVQLIQQGDAFAAGQRAASESGFVTSTVRYFGAMMLTSDVDPTLELNDSLATVMGSVRDNADARDLLTGNYIYGRDPRFGDGRPRTNSNQIFFEMENQTKDLSMIISKYSPQWNLAEAKEVAGLLTTRWWASINYLAGTNRRVVPAIFSSFLCKPIESWKRPNLPVARIRQDIDRFPKGNAAVFQTECRTCHAPMDGFAGAFANIDFQNDTLRWFSAEVIPKYLIHAEVYPDGYVTKDNSWINFLADTGQQTYGWTTTMSGNGILELGRSIAESKLFSECMVKRVFQAVCQSSRELTDEIVVKMARDFRSQGYKLKDLFIRVAISDQCRK